MNFDTAKAWGEQFVARADLATWTALCLAVLALLWLVHTVRSAQRHAALSLQLAGFRSLDRRIAALDFVVNRGMAGLVRQQAAQSSTSGLDPDAEELRSAP